MRGYWGVGKGIASSKLLTILKVSIMTKPATEIIVEKMHHILIWPLIVRSNNPDKIESWISALPSAWTDSIRAGVTSVASDVAYEEVVYYHPFARDFLYADGLHPPDKRPCRRFVRSDVQRVKVTLGRSTSSPELDLKVERAELYLCKPNIALFCLEVSSRDSKGNYQPLALDLVHDFRDQLRRVHPPFFWGGRQPESKGAGLCPKKVEWDNLATPIGLSLEAPRSEFVRFTNVGAEPPVFAHWQCWFGDRILPFQKTIDPTDTTNEDRYFYQQIMDERMQCMTYLAVENPREVNKGDRDRLTFVDSAGPDKYPYNLRFLKRNREFHTYDRFGQTEYQTLYYFCSYAFTSLGKAWEDCTALPADRKSSFYSNYILTHFREQYYRMGVIAHFQRAALLYFADEMSTAAKLLADVPAELESENEQYRKHMNRVQMEFLKFRSRSYFPDVTNQQQGQEMNRLWHNHLGIRDLFQQVDQSCDQINEVFTQRVSEGLAKSQEKLARTASFYLPITVGFSLLAVLFADAILPKLITDSVGRSMLFIWISILVIALASAPGFWLAYRKRKNGESISKRRKRS